MALKEYISTIPLIDILCLRGRERNELGFAIFKWSEDLRESPIFKDRFLVIILIGALYLVLALMVHGYMLHATTNWS